MALDLPPDTAFASDTDRLRWLVKHAVASHRDQVWVRGPSHVRMPMFRRWFGVKCYSAKTSKVFYLYKSELDGRYIRANFTNSPIGLAWVLADELSPSEEIKHPPLDPDQTRLVQEIMSNLTGVYDRSFDEWALGFRKDQDIDRNIAEFWFLSGRFKSIQDSLILDPQEKADLFRMMMAVMNNGKEFALQNTRYSGQIERDKAELVRKFTCAEKDLG